MTLILGLPTSYPPPRSGSHWVFVARKSGRADGRNVVAGVAACGGGGVVARVFPGSPLSLPDASLCRIFYWVFALTPS
jgi:hypothetical protein